MVVAPSTISRLPIRQRHTLDGSGRRQVAQSVLCPRRGGAVGVATCVTCPYVTQIVRTGSRPFVACWQADGEEEPRPSRGPAETPVAEVMSTTVVCVRPDLDVETVGRLLLDSGFGSAPVVDDAGRPIGVVSRTDLLREAYAAAGTVEIDHTPRPTHANLDLDLHLRTIPMPRVTVEDVMVPLTFSVPEDAPLSLASALMAYEGVHHLPVVSEAGEVVGILSALDVLRWLARRDAYLISPRPTAE